MANPERYSKLSATLGSLGYKEIMEPRVAEELAVAINKLVETRRDASESDDFLRGRISALNWFLKVFKAELKLLSKEVEKPVPALEPSAVSPYEEHADDELLLSLTTPQPQTKDD